MAILVGIDEAGFGPILGPLVVSSSALGVPDNLVWANHWEILRASVSDKRAALKGRLLIVDSKKAFTRTIGIKHLRRTVLATLKHLGSEPKNLTELISSLCPDCLEHIAEYPWYKKAGDYRLGGDDGDIGIAVSMLRADLANQHIELLGLKSRCLEVAHYNRMVTAVDNKAKVLFTAVAELMQSAMRDFTNDDLDIVVDRQGGRSHYQRQLQLMFGESQLRIIHEDQDRSSYELTAKNLTAEHAESAERNKIKTSANSAVSAVKQNRRIRVHFVVGADSKFLPVSLASMACKYLREVLVENINNYFLSFNPAIKPTAGYWQDGLRFIEDIKTHIPNLSFNTNQLIRCR
jgi:ribonuclease HII